MALEAVLERSAYCAGENIKLRAEIQNGSDQDVWLVCKLVQVMRSMEYDTKIHASHYITGY